MAIHEAQLGTRPVVLPLGEDLLHVIWRRRRGVLVLTGGWVFGAVLYLVLAKGTYTVATQLYVERRAGSESSDRSQEYLHAQVALLRSTSVLRSVLERGDVKGLSEVSGWSQPLLELRDRLHVEVGRKDGIVTVSLECHDAEQGVSVLSAIVDGYIGHQEREGLLPPANVGILESAEVELAERRPRKSQVVAVGAGLGLMCGVGWALLGARSDQRLCPVDEVACAGRRAGVVVNGEASGCVV